MIARLRGILVYSSKDNLVVDVAGVGYELSVTSRVLEALPSIDQEITLIVYTDVKETAISLFGFRDELEKQVFLLLKKVKGIGSKLALSIVSSVGPVELLATIGQSDVTSLKKVPGVGKKTAERLIVELRENVGKLVESSGDSLFAQIEKAPNKGSSTLKARAFGSTLPDEMLPSCEIGAESDAALALEKLGFSAEQARKAVSEAMVDFSAHDPKSIDAGELLHHALAKL